MTKARESGDNEITDEARRKAARTGKDVCTILAAMLRGSERARYKSRQKKIEKAQKFLGCRTIRKRRSNP